ncbi:MAG: hypothetical protein EZS28_014074 [Streblomastix strix]|uniref:Uncharacterized protein n=1 Tax=Streblomastix strix TaxID=222440 RepID=A0A5J4W630_9EUKA|nr:MAG: hypothetical protein EZS28_014074 [Streblomastix strix]
MVIISKLKNITDQMPFILRRLSLLSLSERDIYAINKLDSTNSVKIWMYLCWFLDTSMNQTSMTKQGRAEKRLQINRRRRSIEKKNKVRIKWWANLIGKLTFLRLQIKNGGLYMRQMNKQQKQQSEAILTNYASEALLGAILEILEPKREIKLSETSISKWNLTSSNQREKAALYLALYIFEKDLKNFKITSLRIQSDNSTAVFNLNLGAADTHPALLVNQIIEKLESMEMILTSFLILVESNIITDAFSRLSIIEEYEMRQELLQQELRELDIQPTVDIFANRYNRKCRNICRIISDRWVLEQYDFKLN